MYKQLKSQIVEFIQAFQDEVEVTDASTSHIERFEMLGDKLLEQAEEMQDYAGVEFTESK